MRDFERAAAELGAIREQLARSERFHGLGPNAFAATGVFAGLAAVGQARWLAEPAQHVGAFLALWVAVAAVSAGVIGFEMVTRSRRLHSPLADETLAAAVALFLPAAAGGALTTLVVMRFAPQVEWLLPSLWQLAYGLGIFASCRFLPRALAFVGAWYVACGLASLAFAQGPAAFSPWSMGLAFGLGQLMVAAVLLTGEPCDE
ncbi:MAG TPA: hypothetical protein VFI86_10535 [Burkholderiales bacterium]|nr:hypothetical protein [Burkholderiales bacterium]